MHEHSYLVSPFDTLLECYQALKGVESASLPECWWAYLNHERQNAFSSSELQLEQMVVYLDCGISTFEKLSLTRVCQSICTKGE